MRYSSRGFIFCASLIFLNNIASVLARSDGPKAPSTQKPSSSVSFVEVEDARDFFFDHRDQWLGNISEMMSAHHKKYIFVISFLPNDFGKYADKNLNIDANEQEDQLPPLFRGIRVSVPKHSISADLGVHEAVQLSIWNLKDTTTAGWVEFRHMTKPQAAILALHHIFGSLDASTTKDFEFVGVAGSHGASALKNFRAEFKKLGFDLGMIFLHDAIEQPFMSPMRNFYDAEEAPLPGIHFFQQSGRGDGLWLNGVPIRGFVNIRLKNTDHTSAAFSHNTFEFLTSLKFQNGVLISKKYQEAPDEYYFRIASVQFPKIDDLLEHSDVGIRSEAAAAWLSKHGDLNRVISILKSPHLIEPEYLRQVFSSYSQKELESVALPWFQNELGPLTSQNSLVLLMQGLSVDRLKELYEVTKGDISREAVIAKALVNKPGRMALGLFEDMAKRDSPAGSFIYDWLFLPSMMNRQDLSHRVISVASTYLSEFPLLELTADPNWQRYFEQWPRDFQNQIFLSVFHKSSASGLYLLMAALRKVQVDEEVIDALDNLILHLKEPGWDPREQLQKDTKEAIRAGRYSQKTFGFNFRVEDALTPIDMPLDDYRRFLILRGSQVLDDEWKANFVRKLRETGLAENLILADGTEQMK